MTSTEFANDVLQTHNKYRAKHGAPGLKISEKLNQFAQEWANNLASTEKMEHRTDNPYGENLYMAGSTDPNWKLKGETAVKSWYDEIKLYKFGEPSPKNSGEVGHFTQLVWKGTTELGIGEAKSKAGKVYVVCNYDPPGNVLREFGKNVLPLDKTAQAMEDAEEAERERIVLTASQEKMGIRIVQPNTQIVESMKRLYAVPSEKLRVWSVWLTKIEEEADEWHSWLRSHINLVLRMSEYLQKARDEIARESGDKEIINEVRDPSTGVGRVDELYREGDEKKVEETSGAADAGQGFEGSPRVSEEITSRETVRFLDDTNDSERNSAMVDTTETPEEAGETGNEEVASGGDAEEASEAEPGEPQPSGARTPPMGENNGDTNDRNREERRNSGDTEREREEGAEELEKIAWPIGVPWEPAEPSSTGEKEVAKKKDDEVKIIPIPGNAEEMLSLIKDVRHQATIYASLYKHWLEVADRAVKEITNRTVMPSDRLPTDEEVPYFFHLYVEPDIEIAVDNDDETILEPDRTREKITSEFTSLYFNLADKPGKGGKPWL